MVVVVVFLGERCWEPVQLTIEIDQWKENKLTKGARALVVTKNSQWEIWLSNLHTEN